MKELIAFVLFPQPAAAASELAASRLREAPARSQPVYPGSSLVIALQRWLPTAVTVVLVLNVALERWGLHRLLAIPGQLATLVAGGAIASLLLRRASRRVGSRGGSSLTEEAVSMAPKKQFRAVQNRGGTASAIGNRAIRK